MMPLLEEFEAVTQIFQSDQPRKHCVIPVLCHLHKILHERSKVGGAWGTACEKAISKLLKYLRREVSNPQTLIATILDPAYRDRIFRQCGLPESIEITAIAALRSEYLKRKGNTPGRPSTTPASVPRPKPSGLRSLHDIYANLGGSNVSLPNETADEDDEVSSYLRTLHPSAPGELIGQYWHVRSPFSPCKHHFPTQLTANSS